MKFVTLSAARNTLPALIAGPDRAVITRNGQPAAVLLGFEEFRAMRADLLLLRSQAQLDAVEETLEAVRAGQADDFPEVFSETAPNGVEESRQDDAVEEAV